MTSYDRDRTPHAAPSDDPFAELNRLVGQPDPFVASNSVSADAGAAEVYEEIDYGDLDIATLDDDPFFVEDEAPEGDLAVSSADHDDAYDGYEPAVAPGYAAMAAQPSRNKAPVAALALGVAVLGAAGVYGYGALNGDVGPAEPVLITAEATPVKTTPDAPSGRQIPHQNKSVYDRVGEAETVETATLLPEPETVRDLPAGVNRAEPKRVRTVTVRPDGSFVRDDDALQPVSAPSEQPITSQQVARPVAVRVIDAAGVQPVLRSQGENANALANFSAADRVEAAPASIEEIAESSLAAPLDLPEQAEAVPAVEEAPAQIVLAALPPARPANLPVAAPAQVVEVSAPAVAAPQPAAQPAAAASSGWMIQLSSQRSEAKAREAFDGLSRRFSSVLGGKQPTIARADLGERGVFYRVRLASASRAEADRTCGALKAQGGDCFVQFVN